MGRRLSTRTFSSVRSANGTSITRRRGVQDAVLVSFMRSADIKHIYSFDGDFDEFDDITRLNAAVDPFEP